MNTVDTGAPSAPQTEQTTAFTAERARSARIARAGRIRRGLAMAAVIAAGTGVIGLGTGVGGASAETAPAHAGWDGSRYWFKNSQGEWRWTAHLSVYQARTGTASSSSSSSSAVSVPSSAGGITQGWDGSVYWFRNSSGQWRWTSHEDVYLQRTGAAPAASSDTAAASSGQSSDVETAVAFALAQLGKPFLTAGNGPDGYDCSGLVQQAFRRGGIDLPRVANDQYAATTPVTASQLRRGDLLFWSEDGTARGIEHVAIYLGGNQYVEAARPGTNIRISGISSGYYPSYMGRP